MLGKRVSPLPLNCGSGCICHQHNYPPPHQHGPEGWCELVWKLGYPCTECAAADKPDTQPQHQPVR